jgi:hypothetical protein
MTPATTQRKPVKRMRFLRIKIGVGGTRLTPRPLARRCTSGSTTQDHEEHVIMRSINANRCINIHSVYGYATGSHAASHSKCHADSPAHGNANSHPKRTAFGNTGRAQRAER